MRQQTSNTCNLHFHNVLDIPAREYLAAVLPGMADIKIQKLADLTPAAWAARNR